MRLSSQARLLAYAADVYHDPVAGLTQFLLITAVHPQKSLYQVTCAERCPLRVWRPLGQGRGQPILNLASAFPELPPRHVHREACFKPDKHKCRSLHRNVKENVNVARANMQTCKSKTATLKLYLEYTKSELMTGIFFKCPFE